MVFVWVAGCGGKQVDLSMPIDSARVLNSELSSYYVRTRTLLEDSTAQADSFASMPDSVSRQEVDADLLRQAMEECFTAPVVAAANATTAELPRRAEASLGSEPNPLTRRPDVGRIKACNPPRLLAIEVELMSLSDDAKGFLGTRILEVDSLRSNLNDVLPDQIDELERQVRRAGSELLALRSEAEEKRAQAQGAGVDEETRRRAEIDFETVSQELDQVEAAIEQITSEIEGMRQLRRNLIDRAAESIARFPG